VVSFLTIGIMWVNHHAMFTLIAGVDRTLIFLNLLLLLAIAALPFPTKLMADYLLAGGWDARTAALVYSVHCLAIGVASAPCGATSSATPTCSSPGSTSTSPGPPYDASDWASSSTWRRLVSPFSVRRSPSPCTCASPSTTSSTSCRPG